MAKTNINFTVDGDVADAMRSMKVNQSKLVNDFLKSFVLNKAYKSSIRPKVTELENIIQAKFEQVSELQTSIIQTKMDLELLKEEAMKEEVQHVEVVKQNVCCICNQSLELCEPKEKMTIDSTRGKVAHRHCYLTLSPDQWKRVYS